MTEDVMRERFGRASFIYKPEAPILHFHPDPATGRDEFGNRIFSSPTYAYYDREFNAVKAALLVSPEGDTFIKQHPGILNAIDRAISAAAKEQDTEKVYELGKHGALRFLGEGSQSRVYKLDTREGSYVIKTLTKRYTDIEQPFINEMLQIQELDKEFGDIFRRIGGRLPTVLFASGQLSCMRYEDGRHPTEREMEASAAASMMFMIARDYIKEKQHGGVLLWNNILTDYENIIDQSYRNENFIVKDDGTYVWIDPFLYSQYTEEELRTARLDKIRIEARKARN